MERPQPTEQQMIALALWWTSAIFGTPLRSNGDTSLQNLMASALQTEIAAGDGTTRTVSYKSCTETPLPGELESSYYLGCSHVIFVDGVRNEFQHTHYFFSAIRRVNDDGTLSYI